jgi:hypothetical protein
MKTIPEMQRTQPVKMLTEAELQVSLPVNMGEMTLAEIQRWIQARAAS